MRSRTSASHRYSHRHINKLNKNPAAGPRTWILVMLLIVAECVMSRGAALRRVIFCGFSKSLITHLDFFCPPHIESQSFAPEFFSRCSQLCDFYVDLILDKTENPTAPLGQHLSHKQRPQVQLKMHQRRREYNSEPQLLGSYRKHFLPRWQESFCSTYITECLEK